MKLRCFFARFGLCKPTTPRISANLMEAAPGRLSPWRHDGYFKPLVLRVRGGGMVDDWLVDKRPKLEKLPPCWVRDHNGFYTYTVPVYLVLTPDDFVYGENASYPANLKAARLTEWSSDTRFLMSADKIALNLYHYMKRCIPGFRAINGEQGHGSQTWRKFRIVVEGWGEIQFHNFGGDLCDDKGNVLLVQRDDYAAIPLLKRPLTPYKGYGNSQSRDIYYPGAVDPQSPAFILPTQCGETLADNIITVFAVVHAIHRMAPTWDDPRGPDPFEK